MPPKVKAIKAPKALKEPESNAGDGEAARTPSSPAKSAKDLKKTIPIISRTVAGVNETRVAKEVEAKEQHCREKFHDSMHFMKKSRNPTIGELTPRDDADFLIPMKKTIKQDLEEQAFANYERTRLMTLQQEKDFFDPVSKVVKPRDLQGINNIKERRGNLDNELEQMKRVLEYKKQALAKLSLR
jgi:hypothetical protein